MWSEVKVKEEGEGSSEFSDDASTDSSDTRQWGSGGLNPSSTAGGSEGPGGVPGSRRSARKQLTPENEERRRIRRERNKLAAARCRQRRVDLTNQLLEETVSLEEQKSKLEREIESLNRHRHQLEYVLSVHTPRCTFISPHGGGQGSGPGLGGGSAVKQEAGGRGAGDPLILAGGMMATDESFCGANFSPSEIANFSPESLHQQQQQQHHNQQQHQQQQHQQQQQHYTHEEMHRCSPAGSYASREGEIYRGAIDPRCSPYTAPAREGETFQGINRGSPSSYNSGVGEGGYRAAREEDSYRGVEYRSNGTRRQCLMAGFNGDPRAVQKHGYAANSSSERPGYVASSSSERHGYVAGCSLEQQSADACDLSVAMRGSPKVNFTMSSTALCTTQGPLRADTPRNSCPQELGASQQSRGPLQSRSSYQTGFQSVAQNPGLFVSQESGEHRARPAGRPATLAVSRGGGGGGGAEVGGLFELGLDCLVDGHTGLTPLTGCPSVGTPHQSGGGMGGTCGGGGGVVDMSPTTLMTL